MYKFRTRYESDLRTTIADWRIADFLKSTIWVLIMFPLFKNNSLGYQ